MKRILFYIQILFIFCNTLYGINNYDFILIKTINNGSKDGELLWGASPAGGNITPTEFNISKENEIYVCDAYNARVNIYNLNLIYNRKIIEKKDSDISSVHEIKIDKNGSIIGHYPTYQLEKINKNGSIRYIKKEKELLIAIRRNSFFPYEDYVLFYDFKKEINFLNLKGEIVNKSEKEKILKDLKDRYPGTLRYEDGLKDKLDEYLVANNLVLKSDRLLNSNSFIFKRYITFIRGTIKNKNIKDVININLDNISIERLIGFDKYDNYYWDCNMGKFGEKRLVLVFSKYGEVLDCFYNTKKIPQKAVAPNGDVYFMDQSPFGTSFYKVKAVWNE